MALFVLLTFIWFAEIMGTLSRYVTGYLSEEWFFSTYDSSRNQKLVPPQSFAEAYRTGSRILKNRDFIRFKWLYFVKNRQFDWFLISFVVQLWSGFSRTWLDVSRTALQYSWGSLCFGALANMALKPIRVVLRVIMLLTKSCGICSQVRRFYKQMLAFRL